MSVKCVLMAEAMLDRRENPELSDQRWKLRTEVELPFMVAWLDDRGNGEYLTPVHPDRTLLDVTAGDDVIHNRETRYTVRRLKPWRTSECRDERAYQEIRCGREWESCRDSV